MNRTLEFGVFPGPGHAGPGGLTRAREMLRAAMGEGIFAGSVAVIAQAGRIVGYWAEGWRQRQPEEAAMTLDTRFDLASLTKVMATAPLTLQAIEAGMLRLEDPVGMFLPAFPHPAVTVGHCLSHRSGLMPLPPLPRPQGRAALEAALCALPLRHPPGEVHRYSDVGYLILGRILERLAAMPLDLLFRERIAAPLGLSSLTFGPVRAGPVAATEPLPDGTWAVGVVHDPASRAQGGVAGNAGLFGAALDVALMGQCLLQGGELRGRRILSPRSVATMTRPLPGLQRGYGFATAGEGASGGNLLSPRAFGHTGYTGTSLWVDPEGEVVVVLLTNRVHPRKGDERIKRFRPLFHNTVLAAFPGAADGSVPPDAGDSAVPWTGRHTRDGRPA